MSSGELPSGSAPMRPAPRLTSDAESGVIEAAVSRPFVPSDFQPPTSLSTSDFRLEPLGPEHNHSDHAAWMSSIAHIRATPGFPSGDWPPLKGMSAEANLRDLQRHATDFVAQRGFTYTVLDQLSAEVIGCVYLYPAEAQADEVSVRTWVRADRAHLDVPLAEAVAAWLDADWPWRRIHGRSSPS